MVEAAGVEPASGNPGTGASTYLACVLISPRDLPQAGYHGAGVRLSFAGLPAGAGGPLSCFLTPLPVPQEKTGGTLTTLYAARA